MHELSLMQAALEVALETAGRQGAQRIHRITLTVGERAGVVREALEFAFEAVTPGTPAAGATLVIQTEVARCHCQHCGQRFRPADWIFLCPVCGQITGHLEQGQALELSSLEVS